MVRTFGGGSHGHAALLHVRGGSGGTTVGLGSLEAGAGVLADVGQDVAAVALRVMAVGTDPDVAAGCVLSPATGALAVAALVEVTGPGGLSGDATGLLTLSAAVAAATAGYREADQAAARAVERAQDTVMFVVGGLAPEILVGVLTLDALGVDVAGVLDEVAFDEPGLADLAGGAEGLVLGLRTDPLTAPLVPAVPRSEGLPPGQDYEQAVRVLADSAALWGLLSDRGRARVTAEPQPREGALAPRSLRALAADQRNVGDGETYAGHVRVIEVPQEHGSVWIVEISGTQEWGPRAGSNPLDVTTDVRTMAQDATVLADGVQQALDQAQAVSGGSPSGHVMLVGHSLGGIAAAGLASSPRFIAAHPVTHVVTMGSPVGRMPVPAGIEVLSLEHAQDAVPRLDGQPNPDRATWVTVSRDLREVDPGRGGAAMGGVDEGVVETRGLDRASQAHDSRLYVDTAALVDDSVDPSVVGWRATGASFFAGDDHGEPVVRDFAIERVAP